MPKRSFSSYFGPKEAYTVGSAVYRGYKRARAIIRGRRGWTADLPGIPDTSGRRPPSSWGFGSDMNNGYGIHNRKARNVKRRRKYSRKNKIRSSRRNKVRMAGIAGKLLSKVWKRMFLVNEIESSRGRVAILNTLNSTTNYRFLPLHLYDITNVHHSDNAGPGVQQLAYFQTPAVDTAKLYWFGPTLPLKVQPDAESGGNQYNLEDISASYQNAKSTLQDIDTEKWYQHDVKVDLLMYGQKDRDTMYRVDVVQFDPKFIELMRGIDSENAADSLLYRDWNQFWSSLIIPYTQTPLAKRYRGKYMKILKTYKFKMPELSSEYAQQQCVKTKITIPMNRLRDRYWHRGIDDVAGIREYDPEDGAANNLGWGGVDTINSSAFGQGCIHPKKRVFLMIRATNTNSNSTADGTIAITPGDEPTYDITIRSKFSVNV